MVYVIELKSNGFVLYAHGEKLFIGYEYFPDFKDKQFKDIINVRERGVDCFFWPTLNIEITRKDILNAEPAPTTIPVQYIRRRKKP